MEGEKKKILIVDDDNFLLDMYALKFSQSGFEVHTARSGVAVMEKLGSIAEDVAFVRGRFKERDEKQ